MVLAFWGSVDFVGSTGFVAVGESTGVDSVAVFCVDRASAFAVGCAGFGVSFTETFGDSTEDFAVAFGASEAVGLAGVEAVAVGVFALVVAVAEASTFAVEEEADEAGAVC